MTQHKSPRSPLRKAHCLWDAGDASVTMCGSDRADWVMVTPHAFLVIEQRDGYMRACRHCARNLHNVVSSLTRFGVAMLRFDPTAASQRSSGMVRRSDDDAAAITRLIADRPLCVNCIGAQAGLKPVHADTVVTAIRTSVAITETAGRCHNCRSLAILYRLG